MRPDGRDGGRSMPGVPETGAEDPRATSGDGGGSCESDTTESDGGDPGGDDLTTAFTYAALTRVADPAAVVDDAQSWSDWVGVVGDVGGPTLNKFFRTHGLDVSFTNDISDGPIERLAEIDEHHHQYAERRVLVGLPDQESWAEDAGWEFEALGPVAEESGWELRGE